MKGTALSVFFVGNFETTAFDKLRNGGILQGMPLVCLWAFGPLSLGLFSDLWVSPVSDPVGFPPATRLDFRILGPVGKDLSNGPFAEVAWALRILRSVKK